MRGRSLDRAMIQFRGTNKSGGQKEISMWPVDRPNGDGDSSMQTKEGETRMWWARDLLTRIRSREFLQQSPCFYKIGRAEAFGKPIIDPSQQGVGFLALILPLPQTA